MFVSQPVKGKVSVISTVVSAVFDSVMAVGRSGYAESQLETVTTVTERASVLRVRGRTSARELSVNPTAPGKAWRLKNPDPRPIDHVTTGR